jgi:hypothetical protein
MPALPTLDEKHEAALARALAHAWNLDVPIPSVLGLRSVLSRRLVEVGHLAAQEARLGAAGRDERLMNHPLLGVALIPTLSAGLDALEALVPGVLGQKWAVLFDELELAPPEIRNTVLESLRSIDDRLLFKMALSPFSEDLNLFKSAVTSMPGHDHDEISLSYGRKESGYDFTLDLMQAILNRRGHDARDLLAVFGESIFPLDTTLAARFRQVTERAESTNRQNRLVRQLDRDDRSFHRYVLKVAGSVEKLLALKGDSRAQKLRKVLPLVIVRGRKANAVSTRGRTRRPTRASCLWRPLLKAIRGG